MYVDSTFGWPPDGDQYVASQLRDSLEPLLRKYAVDVTWHGHHHRCVRGPVGFRQAPKVDVTWHGHHHRCVRAGRSW